VRRADAAIIPLVVTLMQVDVISDIEIRRPVSVVADYVINPENAPSWYVNIKSVEWVTTPPVEVGSRIAFVAQFLGRRIEYVYEVAEVILNQRLVMRTAQGPFPMETTYTFEPTADGGTRMLLRNRGTPSGFSWLIAPLMSWAVRSANRKDLVTLKRLLEYASSQ
jgi:uncharacterized membrane protein